MGCKVHIGREFTVVPNQIRKQLRTRLEKICAALEALKTRGAFVDSISESSLAVTVGAWRFRYEFEPDRNRLVVVQAFQPG
jgi:hypothetical protein